MAHNIVITPLAHLDEYEAYEWYETQRNGLGEEFLLELETAYHKIALQPTLYAHIDEQHDLRDYLLPRFPFLIVYRTSGNKVIIITVHHAKKHPSKKLGNPG